MRFGWDSGPVPVGGGGAGTYPGPLIELQSSPTDSVRLIEVRYNLWSTGTGSAAMVVGLGIPAAPGIGIQNFRTVAEDTSDSSAAPNLTILSSWTRLPTVPATYIRRMTGNWASPSAIRIVFNFPRGIVMAPSSSLVLWLITGIVALSFAAEISVTVDS